MKKTLLTAAAVLISASAFAQTVTSANIVGYVKADTPEANGFTMVAALPFGTEDTVNIQNVIADTSALVASTDYDTSDKLLVFNNGYSTYGLYAGASSNYWMAAGPAWVVPTLPKVAANADLGRGTAFWIKAGTGSSATNIIMSGEVPEDGTYSVDVVEGFNMVAYPFSSTINLTNLVVSNAVASTDYESADKIMIFDSGYASYGLYDGPSGEFWMAAGPAWVVPTLPKVPANVDVDLGSGFWFRSVNAKTIGFTQNYTLD